MGNFTEGPWVAKGGEVCTEEYEAEGQIMNDHICCCEVINGESPNANLIAAAPELLDALQDMLSGWKYIREQHGDLYGVGWDRAQQKAESALSKALGQ